MQTLRSLGSIVNGQTLLVTISAVLSTYLCRQTGLTADFPLTLIGTAIIFPVVFSIGGAYKRREAALGAYGSIKAHGRSIFFATRDWIEIPSRELQGEAKVRLDQLLIACRELFRTPVSKMNGPEERVYREFSELSRFIRGFRDHGLAGGEVSRCNQFLSKMVIAFETVKHIYQYRTPRTLRAYSQFFIWVLPALYGPYFALIAQDFSPKLVYVMPILFSVVLVGLENIQEHLENPFDQIGEDDVIINAEKFVSRLEVISGAERSLAA
jgi:predicted membrane chloride channel (bestrophin family)